jgi:hypothetical protein
VSHTSLRGPHKSSVVHSSSEPDKSSRGRAESWTSLRRAPARRGGPLQRSPRYLPPAPSRTTKWPGSTAADDSGGSERKGEALARFCDRRAALDNHGISSKSAAVMPRDLRGIGRPTVSAFCVNHSDRRLVPVAGPPSSPARP